MIPAAALGAWLAAGPASAACPPAPMPKPDMRLLQASAAELTDWRQLDGDAAVVEFWATFCAPCVEAIPHLNALSDQFKGKPVKFIFVTPEDEGTVKKFLDHHPMHGWIGLEKENPDGGQNEMEAALDLSGIPKTVLIDRQGRLIEVLSPESVTAERIQALIDGTLTPAPSAERAPGAAGMDSALFSVSIATGSEEHFRMSAPGDKHFVRLGFRLAGLMTSVYGVPFDRVDAGTHGLDLYDFDAYVPDGLAADRPALQAALEAALHRKVLRVARRRDAYVLARGPGPLRLSAAAPDETPADFEGLMDRDADPSYAPGVGWRGIRARRQTLSGLARFIEEVYDIGKPVADETGLAGAYDFDWSWDSKKPGGLDRALQDAGLTLKPAARDVEMLVFE